MATVLIAEPTPEIRDLLALLVERVGHKPVFPDGEANGNGIALALAEPTDPVAYKVVADLRAGSPDLPIVFVSVEPPSDRTRALAPTAHLEKPFSLNELVSTLTALLR